MVRVCRLLFANRGKKNKKMMSNILAYVLGQGRVTSILGLILGAPGIHEAVTAFGSGAPVNFRALLSSVGLVLLGRFAAQEPKTT